MATALEAVEEATGAVVEGVAATALEATTTGVVSEPMPPGTAAGVFVFATGVAAAAFAVVKHDCGVPGPVYGAVMTDPAYVKVCVGQAAAAGVAVPSQVAVTNCPS